MGVLEHSLASSLCQILSRNSWWASRWCRLLKCKFLQGKTTTRCSLSYLQDNLDSSKFLQGSKYPLSSSKCSFRCRCSKSLCKNSRKQLSRSSRCKILSFNSSSNSLLSSSKWAFNSNSNFKTSIRFRFSLVSLLFLSSSQCKPNSFLASVNLCLSLRRISSSHPTTNRWTRCRMRSWINSSMRSKWEDSSRKLSSNKRENLAVGSPLKAKLKRNFTQRYSRWTTQAS